MHGPTITSKRLLLSLFTISALTVLAFFIWEGFQGLNLWDEGFFWYGVQRVLYGEVPLRDFQAYDPFRYYWSAALMAAAGQPGMIALRGTAALMQLAALFCGLLAVAHGGRRSGLLLSLSATSVALAAWMIPYFKMADLTASILLVAALTMLIAAPTARRYVLAGVCVGFAACLGRNHGLYGLAGASAAIVWLNVNRSQGPGFVRGSLLFASGVVFGFLPMIAMLCLVPGFAGAFWDSIQFLLEYKATNIALPVPWPWLADFSGSIGTIVRDVMLGLFFIALPLFGVLALVSVSVRRWQGRPVLPAFAASAFMALPYAHYAYSRADYYHLAFGVFPLLIGCFALALSQRSAAARGIATGALVLACLVTMYGYHAGWQCRGAHQCVAVDVSGSHMRIDTATASELDMMARIARQYAPDGRSFVAAPLWPGAYALLNRKSPTWEIYGLFARPPAFEEAEIARIKAAAPGFALIYDLALDGDERVRYKNSHPLTYGYFADNFERVANPSRPDLELFVARGNPGLAHKPEFLEKSAAERARLAAGAIRLRVLNWGPRFTPQGTVPNAQPNGNAGIWVQVADADDIGEVRMLFDGHPASSTVTAPGSITAAFPRALFDQAGTHSVVIEQLATGTVIKVGTFDIEPK